MHREAQRRYRGTEKGKKAHRQAENRRRHGQNQNNRKNMDDAASTPGRTWDKEKLTCKKSSGFFLITETECHFCEADGLIVSKFPRRGYG
jgi:hypothetical protein